MPTPMPVIPGLMLSSAVNVCYMVPSTDPKLKQVHVTSVRFTNHDATDRTVSVWFVQPGGSPGDSNARFKTAKVSPASSGDPSPFFEMDEILLPGGTIHAVADTAGVIAFSANGASYP